jgi:hypothetical protein
MFPSSTPSGAKTGDMTISLIISSGAPGAEAAALDVALRLKIPYDGYTATSALLDTHPMTRRYRLREQIFDGRREQDEANVRLADATLIFTPGDLGGAPAHVDAYAQSSGRPSFHVDLNVMEPLQAAFHIRIWTDKHTPGSLFVTGVRETAETRIYQAVYDALFSFLMLGRDSYPAQDHPAPEKKPLPESVEEAVGYLVDVLSLKDKVSIANMSADEVGELNQTLGNYIRNAFGLWSGNARLMWSCTKEAGRQVDREDEASAIILGRLALELEKTHKLRSV